MITTAPRRVATREQALKLDHETSVGRLEQFTYNDAIVRKFFLATLVWGLVATLAGVVIATQLAWPRLFGGVEWLSFGRLRPLHTNAAIFAFAGNAIFAAIYYSTQRLCKARMFSNLLGNLHFWGWQLIIVAAACTLPLGITQGKEYAELEWPIDIAIAVVWVGFFGVNFFGTLARRRERHMYVALWFYIATIVTVAMLHVFNSLAIPASPFKSYSVYAGVQDAFMQWWYGHNAVAFFLTTPFLGMMYYFLPKAAEKPIFSYRLSIVHFWSLVFIYIWAGPHHLHYTALPAWASSLGMLFSLMLWMPSWGGGINGLLTLRGAWSKVTADPVLKFFVVGITFYMMSTFEGPMLSIKSINALSHYTDWTIAHVHGGALGWNGFMTFGMMYWLLPRLFQSPLWSRKLAEWHFWVGTIGIMLYVLAIYTAGITQGLMWRAFDESGSLQFPDFIETTIALMPMYWVRVFGGLLYVAGIVMLAVNVFQTWRGRPAVYAEPVHEAPSLVRRYSDPPEPEPRISGVTDFGKRLDVFLQGIWHRRWERLPLLFTIWTLIAVAAASLFEIIPTFLIRSNVPSIASVLPYTPLEIAGREIYIAEGCYNCHSQMIRPIWAETKRYGEYSKPGEFVYDHPFQWGSRRIGPDLAREGGKQSSDWHVRHLENPRQLIAQSIMPSYPHLLNKPLDFEAIQSRVNVMAMLGVPYGEAVKPGRAAAMAREQAKQLATELVAQGGYEFTGVDRDAILKVLTLEQRKLHGIEGGVIPNALDPWTLLTESQRDQFRIRDRQIIAVVAYLQRLGTDINKPAPVASTAPTAEVAAVAATGESAVKP